ncbi:hypothetical protein NDU88_005085 [Pleurodeles waltl]|uniref:Reverse transcriptase domain-containing protein n=1 Tax=Pleurodeles waltl TaxID=8319 RepID=A0AAV7SKS8_PLEWA|nr:hypothetical protein NDU88_005085 [Pleurodeles waltl]
MGWAYFCWRDGGGFVTSTFPPTAGLAGCCGGRIFGGLPSAGQNDRGGFPRPRRDYGGFLTGDLTIKLNKVNAHSPKVGDMLISNLLYADDVVLLSQTKVGLRRLIVNLIKYAEQNGMEKKK